MTWCFTHCLKGPKQGSQCVNVRCWYIWIFWFAMFSHVPLRLNPASPPFYQCKYNIVHPQIPWNQSHYVTHRPKKYRQNRRINHQKLHGSPVYGLRCLLTQGIKDLFQLVFTSLTHWVDLSGRWNTSQGAIPDTKAFEVHLCIPISNCNKWNNPRLMIFNV